VLGLLVAISAANTDTLLPETLRPISVPQVAALAGPFGLLGPHLSVPVLMVVISSMFACYVVVVRASDRLSAGHVLMAVGALNALILLAPPLLSTDIFSYQAYGRMYVAFGANPYILSPHILDSMPPDPLYSYIGAKWITVPTAYSPLFTLISVVLTKLTGALAQVQPSVGNLAGSVAANAFLYKLMAAAGALATCALLWSAARLRGLNPVRAVALFGLNPLVMIWGVGGGHNDFLMLPLTTAAIYFLLAHRERASGASIALGAGIKLTAFMLLPFALASGVELGAGKRRRSLLVGTILASAGVLALGVAFFGTGQLHLLGTLKTVQNEGDWHSVPGFLSVGLHLGTLGHLTGLVLTTVFVVAFVWLVRRTLRGEMDWIDGAGWATLAMLLTASSVLPWYIAWLLPLVALCSDRRLWTASLCFSGWMLFITMLGWLPHGSAILTF
jgi:alpha-1,6-mannosyltransferase